MTFDKNKNLDNIITEVNSLLAPIEKKMQEEFGDNGNFLPVIMLLGAPRSGSTLFTQWVASQGSFAYPSNFMSRFYKAPYVGALIYKMVTDPAYQYKGEFADINQEFQFSSDIGKTKGFKSPHEFWYFWRRFFTFPVIPCSQENFSSKFDFSTLEKELRLITHAFEKPFLFKAHILNWYAESLAKVFPNMLFLHLHRDPVSSVRSLITARENWTGSRDDWFSFKPKEFYLLEKMDVYHQVAGQIYFINRDILQQKNSLGERYISFSYEDFCNNPKSIYDQVNNGVKGIHSNFVVEDYKGPSSFRVSDRSSSEDNEILKAYRHFEDQYGSLNF